MWQIDSLNITTTPKRLGYLADGTMPGSQHSGAARLMINGYGYIDIMCWQQGSGYVMSLNGQPVAEFTGVASLSILVQDGLRFNCSASATFVGGTGDTQTVTGSVEPIQGISDDDITLFREMRSSGIVPYRNPPPPATPRTDEDIASLGQHFFPGNPYAFEMAYAIYDWTSANYQRFLFFTEMVYTGVPAKPMDLPSIQKLVWDAYYLPSYFAENADYMNKFGLKAANNLQEVVDQLTPAVADRLRAMVNAETNIFTQGVLDMPKISTASYPKLYRGAMTITTREGVPNTTNRFAAQLYEFPLNSGPVTTPLQMPLDQAVREMFQPGQTITCKASWSFGDDVKIAESYQNGIIISVVPPTGSEVWPGGASIVDLSINPGATEFNFPRNMRYKVLGSENMEIKDKDGNTKVVLHLELQMLGQQE